VNEHRAFVVAGMHCSGTSLAAGLLHELGVSMGPRFVPADAHNPLGYYEDLDFVELQGRMTTAATPAGPGHQDWGWAVDGELDVTRLASFAAEAESLIDARASRGEAWGWKNPRTSIALDFWAPRLPGASYLLLYRLPWEVADSMQRLGATVFLSNPSWAYRIWELYNRRLLAFLAKARDRCLLVSANALLHEPDSFDRLLRERLGLPVPAGHARRFVKPQNFGAIDGEEPLATLLEATRPDCYALLQELDERADLSGRQRWSPAPRRTWSGAGEAPAVSVLTPCYDHGELLLEAVASAERAAKHEPLELLIVDDGSQEPWTLHVLNALRELGYRVLTQANRGLPAARNLAAKHTQGRYLLPLDADNRLRPTFPAQARQELDREPRAGVVYTDHWAFGLSTEVVRVPAFDLPLLLRGNYIDACALLRRDVWAECGGWDEAVPGWEDWELWIAAAGRGWQFRHLETIGFDYRRRPGSLASSLLHEDVGRRVQGYIVAKHAALYLEHLAEVLLRVQQAHRESAASLHAYESELAGARLEVSTLRATLDQERNSASRVAADLQERVQRETAIADRLTAERQALYEELARWQNRVETMEGTAAWRWRQRLLRLRSALRRGGHGAVGPRSRRM
jgi:glycosyltransferase involved in cell wall biosynthesis